MLDSRRQFRVLYHDSLLRLVDLDLLSAGGDIQKLFGQIAALLAAFSFILAIYLVPPYAFSELSAQRLARAALGDQEFLIATTMAVVGMFAVLSWDSVFPGRRDIAVLGPLPVRTQTMFLAKVSAIATGLAIGVVSVNAFIGLSYPFVAIAPGSGAFGAVRSFIAYWLTMAAAGAFVFGALLAVQGLAAQCLTYRLFLRVSNFLQIGAFFLVLGVYFLTPGSSEVSITAPANQALLHWFPSFWFLGLFQQLNGPVDPVFRALAARALWSLAVAISMAGVTYALAYFRNIRRIIEQPDIVPSDRSRAIGRYASAMAKALIRKPLERAVILFSARTLARSRQHRTILAAYCGIGLAISLTFAKILLYGDSRIYASLRQHITVPRWWEPNVPLMAAGLVMTFFAIAGTRAVFSLPATPQANWIFRITAVHSPGAYFAAVRKALYRLGALPVGIAAAICYFAIWPAPPVFAHLTVLALASVILIERSLFEFRKVPFACSYLPGKSDLKRRLAIYGTLFLAVTQLGTRIELWAMQSPSRYLVLLAMLLILAIRARRRWAGFAAASYNRLQFQDLEVRDVATLDLSRDGAWGQERYIDAVDPEPKPPWRARMKAAGVKMALAISIAAAVGATYEQYGQWRHRRDFPQIGRSVNIDGRSLNIYCSGSGSPAVVFESGAGGPGYGWLLIQREASKFTQACWYDRAGYGWSDSAPFPHTAAAVAEDLHRLLNAAAVPPPYVLVGASLGGFYVRVFNGLYGAEVAGMVLVDSSHIDDREPIPSPLGFLHAQSVFAQSLRQVGLLRVLMDSGVSRPPKGFTEREWRIAESFEPRTLAENAKESYLVSARQARAAGGLGDRPLIVLTAGLPSREAHNPAEARAGLTHQAHWIEIQKQLAALSTKGKQVIVEDSRHGIQFDNPQAVIAAVREIVNQTRARSSIKPKRTLPADTSVALEAANGPRYR